MPDSQNYNAISEADEWIDEVVQLEDGWSPSGGPVDPENNAGILNWPLQHLTKRTRWLKTRVDTLVQSVVAASTSVAGIVKLSSETGSTSETLAATPKAVKAANDNADGRAPKTRKISTSGLATGGGDLTLDRTITVPKATQAEAEAGTDDAKAMTPLRTSQAIAYARAQTAFKSYARQVTDWDLAVTNGVYMAPAGSSNAPSVEWTIGIVMAQTELYVTQDVFAFTVDGAANTQSWRRELNNGVWGDWYRLRISEGEQAQLWAARGRKINVSGLATGGGDLTADRTITVPKATQAEAEAGTDDAKAMTPLRTSQAIAALATSKGRHWQDVTASRAVDTVYTNTDTRDRKIAIRLSDGATLQVSGDSGATWVPVGEGDCDQDVGGTPGEITIPPGDKYKVTVGFSRWSELI